MRTIIRMSRSSPRPHDGRWIVHTRNCKTLIITSAHCRHSTKYIHSAVEKSDVKQNKIKYTHNILRSVLYRFIKHFHTILSTSTEKRMKETLRKYRYIIWYRFIYQSSLIICNSLFPGSVRIISKSSGLTH